MDFLFYGQNETKETSRRQYYDMQMMKAREGHSQLASKISGKEQDLDWKMLLPVW